MTTMSLHTMSVIEINHKVRLIHRGSNDCLFWHSSIVGTEMTVNYDLS